MSYPFAHLGADSFGPPRPGQTDAAFQAQMSAPVALSIGAALMLVNPVLGILTGAGLLAASGPPTLNPLAPNRPSYEERKGGH